MTTKSNNVNGAPKSNKLAVWLASAAGLVGVAMIPSTAQAGHDDDRWDRRDRREWREDRFDRRGNVDVEFRVGNTYREPGRVWVPAEVKIIRENVWVPPVYKTVCEKVWIPARHEIRERVVYDRHGCRQVIRENVCVEPGRWIEQHKQVLVCDGHYDVQERRIVLHEGHWQNVDECRDDRRYERLDFNLGFRR
jgi:hypothetical protein